MEEVGIISNHKFSNSQIVVVVVRVVVGVIFFLTLIYLVLYAPSLANNQLIIPIRRDFYEKVLEKRYLPGRLPYSVMVREVQERIGKRMYGYMLMGRLVFIDYEKERLTLQDKEGRVWRVAYPEIPFSPDQRENMRMFSEVAIDEHNQETSKTMYMWGKGGTKTEDTQYFREGDIIAAMWMEERALPQILKATEDPETSIVLSYPGKIPLYKIVAKER